MGDELFVYELSGDAHETRAESLLRLFRAGSLASFVAEKQRLRRKDGVTVRRVLGLRISRLSTAQ